MRYVDIGLGSAYNADCFDVMKLMPDGCVDMILADLPYGTTACKWDTVIPFEPMWKEFRRICKKNAAIVLTASQPFTSALGASNLEDLRYSWVWKKNNATGHLNAKRMPMKDFEDVLVFHKGICTYNPQGLTPYGKQGRRGGNGACFGDSGKTNFQEHTNYPRAILEIPYDKIRGLHPTQKPVALFEYLIKTYTNENEFVFDPTAGSLTTGVAAQNLGRRWVCCEKLPEYFDKGIQRFPQDA